VGGWLLGVRGDEINTSFISYPTIQNYERFSNKVYWRKEPINHPEEKISFLECVEQSTGEILSRTRTIYIYSFLSKRVRLSCDTIPLSPCVINKFIPFLLNFLADRSTFFKGHFSVRLSP